MTRSGLPELVRAPSRVPLVMLVVANLVSTVGGAMSLVALPWFAFSITRDPALTGVVAACEFTAVVVASACAGWFIQRLGARGTRVLSDVVSGVAVLAVPALFELGALPFGLLLALVAVNGFLRTPAVAASYLLLAGAAERGGTTTGAVSGPYLASLALAGAIGAPVAGAAIAAAGAPLVLVGDAVTFLVSALLVRGFLPRFEPEDTQERPPTVAGALRVIGRSPVLRLMLAGSLVLGLLSSAWATVIAPVYGTEVLRSPAALGFVLTAQSVGSILGAWSSARVERRLSRRRLAPLAVVTAVVPMFLALGTAAPLGVLLPVAFVFGTAGGVYGTMFVNVEYATVPRHQQGHVFGVVTALGQTSSAVGPLLAGVVVGTASLRVFSAAAIVAGLVTAAALLLAAPRRGPRGRRTT
ncbi:MFS transporter [Isoptericola sp. NPDC057559]|uniref:MFS transporter n=1 Tax=Isoptericola sp. NPDC057559 TaxID=3346168 RepID=UPI00368A21FC